MEVTVRAEGSDLHIYECEITPPIGGLSAWRPTPPFLLLRWYTVHAPPGVRSGDKASAGGAPPHLLEIGATTPAAARTARRETGDPSGAPAKAHIWSDGEQ